MNHYWLCYPWYRPSLPASAVNQMKGFVPILKSCLHPTGRLFLITLKTVAESRSLRIRKMMTLENAKLSDFL